MPRLTGFGVPGIANVYAPDCKAERLFSHLAGFKAVLQIDSYAPYPKFAEPGKIELALKAGRRVFVGAIKRTSSPEVGQRTSYEHGAGLRR